MEWFKHYGVDLLWTRNDHVVFINIGLGQGDAVTALRYIKYWNIMPWRISCAIQNKFHQENAHANTDHTARLTRDFQILYGLLLVQTFFFSFNQGRQMPVAFQKVWKQLLMFFISRKIKNHWMYRGNAVIVANGVQNTKQPSRPYKIQTL